MEENKYYNYFFLNNSKNQLFIFSYFKKITELFFILIRNQNLKKKIIMYVFREVVSYVKQYYFSDKSFGAQDMIWLNLSQGICNPSIYILFFFILVKICLVLLLNYFTSTHKLSNELSRHTVGLYIHKSGYIFITSILSFYTEILLVIYLKEFNNL